MTQTLPYICINKHRRQTWQRKFLFDFMLNVPIKSKGHVGTLPPFYGTFTHTNLLSLVAFCMSNFMTSDVTLLHTESKETSIMHGNNHVHYVHEGSHKII